MHGRLGRFCISCLDYRRAVEQFELALAAAERTGDPDLIAGQLHSLADTLLLVVRHLRVLEVEASGGELERAEAAIEALCERTGEDTIGDAALDRLRAELLCEQGLPALGLEILEQSRARGSSVPRAERAAFASIHARVLRLVGRPWEALAEAQRAGRLAATAADDRELILALDELALCQRDVGDLDGAFETARRLNARVWTIHQRHTRQLVQEVWARADLVRERRQLESKAAEARRSAELDALTGIGNRRLLERFLRDAALRQDQIALVLVDLDHFKLINDGFGHNVGDAVLQRIAELLAGEARGGQVAIRFGGDEFLLALPNVAVERATGLAQRLRLAIESQDWEEVTPELHVSASLGVAAGAATRWRTVVTAADAALYAAKQHGRNAVGTLGGVQVLAPSTASEH
jgi:diguanylate cyclase (GGDEF)-like protein